MQYSEDGQPQSVTLADYLLPTATDVPKIEMHHLETLSPQLEGGYKGMAEGGCINSPAAVANAVSDALAPFDVLLVDSIGFISYVLLTYSIKFTWSPLVDRLPITPDWVLEKLRNARASG